MFKIEKVAYFILVVGLILFTFKAIAIVWGFQLPEEYLKTCKSFIILGVGLSAISVAKDHLIDKRNNVTNK